MKFIHFDPYEFDNGNSEQTIIYASSPQRRYCDMHAFLCATLDLGNDDAFSLDGLTISQSTPTPHHRLQYLRNAAQMMATQCGYDGNHPSEIWVLADDWNLWDYAFIDQGRYHRFLWMTTA